MARGVFEESGCLGLQPKMRGIPHVKLNIGTRPIANKYHEGKMKSTLKRELKGLEIVEGEGNGCRCALWFYVKLTLSLSTHCAGQRGLDGRYNHVLPPVRPRSEVTLETLSEGNHFTRLETRTKESNMYASRRVENP